jgi:murein DD-endopeptidase MepM/ murein hydrolase activator NlpD
MADLYIDYSRARPGVELIKSLGCVGAVRYLSDRNLTDSSTNPKDITAAEAQKLLDAGLKLALVWEITAARAGAGIEAGVADAKAAEAQADALGYPAHAVIFYAVDYDTTPTVVTPYFKGINSVAKRPVGVYGGVKIIDGLIGTLANYGWQTIAWSAGKVSGKACLLQNVFKGDYDTSKVLGPFPAWSKAAPEPEPVRVPVTTGKLSPIIPGGSVTTPYRKPGDWAAGYHTGEDWNAPDDLGKPALSAVDGEVVFAGSGGWASEYGKHVIVEDDTGERTAHCHLSSISVKVGQTVRAGQEVGKVGATGRATGAHVHVERRHKPFGYWDHETPKRDLPRPKTKVIKTSELVPGSFCDSVYWLQRALNAVSLVGGKNLRRSGKFDTAVGDEVVKFQKQKAGASGDGLITVDQVKQLLSLAGHTGFTITEAAP